MRLRASGDIVRCPRLVVPTVLVARDARAAPVSGPSEALAAWLSPRLAAQYFFIRSPTALRWAADMVLRRRERVVGASPPVIVACLGLPLLEPFWRSSGKARRIASSSKEISARRAWAPARA